MKQISGLCVKGKRIYRAGNFIDGWFLVEKGKIKRWGSAAQLPPKTHALLDAKQKYVVPGLVDLHIHGFAGLDATESDIKQLQKLVLHLAASGTTTFLATLYPAPLGVLQRQLRAIYSAGIFGAHLEGPFVNPLRAGALDKKYLLPPSIKTLRSLLREQDDVLRKMTIAPELPGALKCIRFLRDAEVIASMGHTDATYQEAELGLRAGATGITHLFNAMRPMHHRELGLVGLALKSPQLSCELIGDLVHVAQPMVELLLLKRDINFYLISDCLRGAGQKQKSFQAGGAVHRVQHGVAYLAGSKTLSGSCQSLLSMVQKLVKKNIFTLEQAIFFAAGKPAQAVGALHKGDLAEGCDADFLLLGTSLNLEKVYLQGLPIKLLAHSTDKA